MGTGVDYLKSRHTAAPSHNLKKNVQLFIKHLLGAQRAANYYIYKNIRFISVYLFGTVSRISSPTEKNKLIITVDDGTAAISCMLDYAKTCRKATDTKETLKKLHYDVLLKNREAVTGATYITTKCSVKKLDAMTNLKLGDNVKIIGKLREFYRDKTRYVYVNRFIIDNDTDHFNEHLVDMFHLYEKIYPSVYPCFAE